MKKIILVSASPRKNGNSEVIVDTLASKLSNAEITVFKIREKKINPCIACAACQGKDSPKCVQKDDISSLLSEMDTCDAIVLAAPIYFHQINAQAKMLLDRLFCFRNIENPSMSNTSKWGKKAVIVCPFWGGPEDVYKSYAEQTAKGFYFMGAKDTKGLVFGKLDEPGSILNSLGFMEKASDLAQWLTE